MLDEEEEPTAGGMGSSGEWGGTSAALLPPEPEAEADLISGDRGMLGEGRWLSEPELANKGVEPALRLRE